MKQDSLQQAKQVYEIEKECIEKMADYFDEDPYSKAVEMLKNAERIGATGCGHSGIICQHFTHLMCCIDRPARFISPAEAVHGGTGFLQKGDVCVFASRGGKTKELLPILDICKSKGVKVITITENLESPLALGADVVLKQYVNRETDKYNCQGTTSSTALAVIFHVLQTALIEETNYQNEQFALIHPGGAVGERLNKQLIKILEENKMEFKFFQKELELQSRGWIPTFHDISKEIIEIVKASGVKNGTVTIASHHTTCSVMVQECSHDIDSFDLEYLQHDLLDIMRKMIPDYTNEGDYRHPGPIHAKFGRYVNEPGDFTSMNTDGHLRSVFFGRSETMTIKDGELDGGEFAHVYFVDWDHVRARRRQVNVTVMGIGDAEIDRKWNNGEVINTLHKFTDEEKADDIHYTLQQQR